MLTRLPIRERGTSFMEAEPVLADSSVSHGSPAALAIGRMANLDCRRGTR